jgi:hypothetical protein
VNGEHHLLQFVEFQIVKSTPSNLAAALASLVSCVIALRAPKLRLVVES